MQRFRLVWIVDGDVREANRLLSLGWRPVREQPLNTVREPGGTVLLVLERDDEAPVLPGEQTPHGISLGQLESVPLLTGLTGAELREFAAACVLGRYEPDALLFDAGQTDRRLYLILEGRVSVQLLGLAIDDPVVLDAGPGDVFGEATFFAQAPHSTRAIAIGTVQTLELDGSAFDDLFQAARPVATRIALNAAALLGQRLHSTDEWIREIMQGEKSSEALRHWRRFRHSLSARSDRGTPGGFFRV